MCPVSGEAQASGIQGCVRHGYPPFEMDFVCRIHYGRKAWRAMGEEWRWVRNGDGTRTGAHED